MPDYVIISPNGKKIPLEIKYYTKRLVGTGIPRKIVERMNLYLDFFQTNEGIIVVSLGLSSETIENMKKSSMVNYTSFKGKIWKKSKHL